MEQTLPFDVARCYPVQAGDKCRNCMRFANHPWQTFNPHWQVCFRSTNPADCTKQIPVSEGGAK